VIASDLPTAVETHLNTPLKALEYAKTRLGAMPSDGLLQLLTDIVEIGLPVKVFDQLGLTTGSATVRRDGIELRLADGPFSEGVLAHEATSALLETRGWPRMFGEAKASGARHYLDRLVNLLDHAAGIALQRDYKVEGDAYESAQLTTQWRRIVQLNRQKEDLLPGLSDSDRIGYSLDVALTAIEQRLRMGSLPVPYLQALSMFTDARALYDQMLQAADGSAPATGWQARRLLKALIDIIDGYLEKTSGGRPLNMASQFVPSLHQDDASRTVSEVATIIETPLASANSADFDIRIVNNRDGLSFRYDESYASAAVAQKQLEGLGNENYATFIRAKVPNAVLIFRPTGD
jgi:hypothetical protein